MKQAAQQIESLGFARLNAQSFLIILLSANEFDDKENITIHHATNPDRLVVRAGEVEKICEQRDVPTEFWREIVEGKFSIKLVNETPSDEPGATP